MSDIIVVCDNRERKLIEKLKSILAEKSLFKGAGEVKFELEQLEIGDFLIKHDQQILCTIERKNYKDFAASLTDGRMETQKPAMIQMREDIGCDLYYLIEGPLNHSKDYRNGITADQIESAILSIQTKSGMAVTRTSDIDATVRMIKLMAEHYSMAIHKGDIEKREQGKYGETPEMYKRRMNVAIWRSFKGIGPETAKKIVDAGLTVLGWLQGETCGLPEAILGKIAPAAVDLGRFYSALPGISAKSAVTLSACGLDELRLLLLGEPSRLQQLKNGNKAIVGKAKADGWRRLFA